MTNSLTLKIEQCSEQVFGPVRKVLGMLSPKNFILLIDAVDLSANPRSAKRGSVTAQIEMTLDESPELFPAKTKGILLASSSYRALERSRYQLSFEDADLEGLLDGGHTSLATGRHILRATGIPDAELKKVSDWQTFKETWKKYRSEIDDVADTLNFQVPIEIQVPAEMSDRELVDQFRTSLLDIGAARNNNVQLSDETKANKQGLYEPLKEYLPPTLADRIEWKSNEGGDVKVREIVALCWIPLSKLDLPEGIRINANQIYRNKGACVEAFNKLLGLESVSSKIEGGYALHLEDDQVRSAIKLGADFPAIYDEVYARFPDLYNKAGGSYGKITAVRMYDPDMVKEHNPKYLRRKPETPFFSRPVMYTCPDGFIVPLLYAMRAIIETDKKGLLKWSMDPIKFLDRYLLELMGSYRLAMDMATFDPQKLGKNIGTYQFIEASANAAIATSKI